MIHKTNLEQQIHDLKQTLSSMREERSAIMYDTKVKQRALDNINDKTNKLSNEITWFECRVNELKTIEKNLNISIIEKDNDVNYLQDTYKKEEHKLAEIELKRRDSEDKYGCLLSDINDKDKEKDNKNILIWELEHWKKELLHEIAQYNNDKQDIEKEKQELNEERLRQEQQKDNLKLFEKDLNIRDRRLKKYKENYLLKNKLWLEQVQR